jgi:hypothetical protein
MHSALFSGHMAGFICLSLSPTALGRVSLTRAAPLAEEYRMHFEL